MKVLLDTNIVIHREASKVIREEIGVLFKWLDRLHYTKCIHPLTIAEIRKHKDQTVVATFNIKLQSYTTLVTEAPESPEITKLRQQLDTTQNDINDTSLIKEVFARRVDFLITEDRGVHNKAHLLGVSDRVFTIDDFLEKVTAENPDLADYKVLSVQKSFFGHLDVNDTFFDTLKEDYPGFVEWFNRKADEPVYITKSETDALLAFLYLKVEEASEAYPTIAPPFMPMRRLKIGTLKVHLNGFKLGERFLKIIFDNAVRFRVDEIYVTIFNKRPDQDRLIRLFEDWGFRRYGVNRSQGGEELVLVRDFSPVANPSNPELTFPYISRKQRKFIVPIYPSYHTELLPDSILNTESPDDFVENRPNRNAIKKVYISRSVRRDMKPGDAVVFYRTASGTGPAHYTSVATTLGIVESVLTRILSMEDFISSCRKRSVFDDTELRKYWNYSTNRPFIVNFLYAYSLPKRPNLAMLKEHGIITDAPRGFDLITDQSFETLITISHGDNRIVVD